MKRLHRNTSCIVLILVWAIASSTAQTTTPLVIRSFDRMLLLEVEDLSASVSIGDLNGDRFPDIVVANGRHTAMFSRILLNDGKGNFIASNLGDAPDHSYSAALADIDRDGRLDVVVSNERQETKWVYRNKGRARFNKTGTFGSPDWATHYVTLADLNGDTFPDIAVANRHMQSYICWNNRLGAFPNCNPLRTESATIIIAADFDRDGAIDLFVPHRDGGRNVVLWNDGKGGFTTSTRFGPSAVNIRAAAAGDLNGDGRVDIVVGDETAGGVKLYLNAGGRAFFQPISLSTTKVGVYSIVIADLNRDGKKDVIVGYVGGRGSIFYNTGSMKAFRSIRWNDGKGLFYGIAVGDLDGDGWPDIVSARSEAPNAVWFSTPTKR
ncbi:amine dehydrogenase [Fragilaria crotonensis]|nr:amine dehydrogenase [Fragilaria crotonensis]